MLAFLPTLGFQEMFVLLVLGLLLFGRNLPDVGRNLGRTIAQLRRGLQEFKDQMDRDGSLRELKNVARDTVDEVKKVTAVPRAIIDPASALRDLTNEALSSPPPADARDAADTGGADARSQDTDAHGTGAQHPGNDSAS